MPYTIEGKEVVVLGDTTTHGGKVITGSENHSYMDIPVARVGDMVECPKCKGVYPIIEGALGTFDHGKPIARHGDKVACGATLISNFNANVFSGAFLHDLPLPPIDPPYTAEELCVKINEVLADENIQKAIQEAYSLTKKTNFEWGGWIVETAPGVYDLPLKTDNSEYKITLGDTPNNAIANFHTHNKYGNQYFSEYDRDTAHLKGGMFDMMINYEGQINFQDKSAHIVICNKKEGGPKLERYE
jgi:uncharacterized Zn-binding protein involved in type VI secretion